MGQSVNVTECPAALPQPPGHAQPRLLKLSGGLVALGAGPVKPGALLVAPVAV